MRRRRLSAVVVATASLALPVAGAVPAAAEEKTTLIRLRVSGCEGCEITPSAYIFWGKGWASMNPELDVEWEGPKLTVRDGRASFRIPTSYTRGMALSIVDSWDEIAAEGFGAVPFVTLSNRPPLDNGAFLTDQTRCWRGTSKRRATLRITVKDWSYSGKGNVPLAYLASLPKPESPRGGQDVPWCAV